MTWKDILKISDKIKDNYAMWALMDDFVKFLEHREFLRLTKEGIEVKEPFYIKDEKEDDVGYAISKNGDILIKGISYPFASYSSETYKERTIDGTESEWDGHIVHDELSLRDAERVIYHFFINHPNEKKEFYEYSRYNKNVINSFERFFAGEL